MVVNKVHFSFILLFITIVNSVKDRANTYGKFNLIEKVFLISVKGFMFN